MQFERFFSLNHSIVTSFPNLHHLGFQPTLPNRGAAICPYIQLKKVLKYLTYMFDMDVGGRLNASMAPTIA
jgi:hypothetical protein